MYWITFVMLSIFHCIGVNSHPLDGRKVELLAKIDDLIKLNIPCGPQAKFNTISSSGSLLDSLDCVRRELETVGPKCQCSEDVILDELGLMELLMNDMYKKTTTTDCDQQKPLQDFLENMKLLVQKDMSG